MVFLRKQNFVCATGQLVRLHSGIARMPETLQPMGRPSDLEKHLAFEGEVHVLESDG